MHMFMGVDILQTQGALFLGSRLKRLADRFSGDAARVLRLAGLPVQQTHLPLLAALHRLGPLSVSQAAAVLGVSQPAATRTIGALAELGLVDAARDEQDARAKLLTLSAAGRDLITRAEHTLFPVVEAAADGMCAEVDGDLVRAIGQLEAAFDRRSLEDRVLDTLRAPAKEGLRIVEYRDDLADTFARITEEWVCAMFALEEEDLAIIRHPREHIVDAGGVILFVEDAQLGIIGTGALMRMPDGAYEITKMGVTAQARGRGAGEFLLRHLLARAQLLGVERLFLLTNTACASAVRLYEKLGFEHDAQTLHTYGSRYARCNVAMSYPRPLSLGKGSSLNGAT